MRPDILNPLFAEVDVLKGVGPQVGKLLKRLDLTRAVDVLYHLPTGAIERVRANAANANLLGRNVILELTPFDTRESRSGRGPMRVFAADGEGNTIILVYFNNPGWAKRSLPKGEKRIVSGKLEQYGDPRAGLSADRGSDQPPDGRTCPRGTRARARASRVD